MECSSRSRLRNCCWLAALLLISGLDVTPAIAALSDNSAAVSKRLAWNKETLVGAYEKIGHNGPAWDTPAKGALSDTATLRATQPSDVEPLRKAIVRQCDEALRAGCKDPMIAYLRTRFDLAYRDIPEPELTRAFVAAADNLIASKYPE
ncbi:MAG TPA: hypothetical protein VK615_01230, partial [Candidatus Binatia bacterium]|nr:hypothetical protein [Candidatus Binatia bacterium]